MTITTAEHETSTSAGQITAIDTRNVAVMKELGYLGKVPALSLLADPRFSYYLYVPRRYAELTSCPLIVLVHGSGRNAYELRDWYRDFAEEHGVFLLCPLFPIGFLDADDADNYKNIIYRGIRYDEILLQMCREVQSRYPRVDVAQFGMYAFSGGAQFAHRFAYLHPKRLSTLVCGAPGTQTMWDESQAYPQGTHDLVTVFGSSEIDWDALRRVPTVFLCGSEDIDDSWCKLRGRPPLGPNGRLGACKRLARSWELQGAKTEFIAIPGAKHEEHKLIPTVTTLFQRWRRTLEIQGPHETQPGEAMPQSAIYTISSLPQEPRL